MNRVCVICIMLPQRITFISDPTNEYPNNTNTKFKVRLPIPLQLEGEWDASLWSLSVPDDHLPNKTLFADPVATILDFKFTMYRLGAYSSANKKYESITLIPKTSTLRLDEVMNESTPADTGVAFWQNCVRLVDETVIEELLLAQNDNTVLPVAIPNAWKPTFKWDVRKQFSPFFVVRHLGKSGHDLWLFAVQQTLQEKCVGGQCQWVLSTVRGKRHQDRGLHPHCRPCPQGAHASSAIDPRRGHHVPQDVRYQVGQW